MSRLNDLADALIQLLADAATRPYSDSPYMDQDSLLDALGVKSVHTLSDVVTRAAVERVRVLHSGSAILLSKEHGYRLADAATKLELIGERTRLRTAHTKLIRTGHALTASGNGPLSQMVGQQLIAFAASVIAPMLDSMDQILDEAL